MRSVAFSLAVILCSQSAYADPPAVLDIPTGQDRIVVVQQGQAAPFTGQLFDAPTALRWANWLQQYKLRLNTDVQLEVDRCGVEQKYNASVLKAEQDRGQTVELDLRARLKQTETDKLAVEAELRKGPAWYNTRDFGVILGVASTVLVVSVSVWAFGAVHK